MKVAELQKGPSVSLIIHHFQLKVVDWIDTLNIAIAL
jgi:hypothetical protein